MSGAGFGSFMSGLSGGLSIGKALQGGMKKADAQPAQAQSGESDTGFSIGKGLVSGDVTNPTYASGDGKTESSPWGFLGGILGGLTGDAKLPDAPGISGSALGGKGLGGTIAGNIINPDDPVAGTIGSAIIGKLLK